MWTLTTVALAYSPAVHSQMRPGNNARVPANLAEAYIVNGLKPEREQPWRVQDGPLLEVLETTENGKRVLLPPLIKGMRMTFEGGHWPDAQPQTVQWTITASSPIPRTLGTTAPLTTLPGRAYRFPEPYDTATMARVVLVMSDEAIPWEDTFRPVLHIDGQPYDPHPMVVVTDLAGNLLIPIKCGEPEQSVAVDPGPHRFQFRTTLMDGTVVNTPEVTHDLACLPEPLGKPGTVRADSESR